MCDGPLAFGRTQTIPGRTILLIVGLGTTFSFRQRARETQSSTEGWCQEVSRKVRPVVDLLPDSCIYCKREAYHMLTQSHLLDICDVHVLYIIYWNCACVVATDLPSHRRPVPPAHSQGEKEEGRRRNGKQAMPEVELSSKVEAALSVRDFP